MKHTLRILICLLLALSMISLAACSGQWKTDVTVDAIATEMKGATRVSDGWENADSDYISASNWGDDYKEQMEKVVEYRILISSDSANNIDEMGIFRLNSGNDAKAFKGFVDAYLDTYTLRMTPILEAYNQAEILKLNNAKVTVCGTYVFYTIVSESNTSAAHRAFEDLLKAE